VYSHLQGQSVFIGKNTIPRLFVWQPESLRSEELMQYRSGCHDFYTFYA